MTEVLARDIYKYKLAFNAPQSSAASPKADNGIRGKSVSVAERFDVSPKTVRDIWSRRTWAYATYPLWSDEQNAGDRQLLSPQKGRPGRPKGPRSTKSRASDRLQDMDGPDHDSQTRTINEGTLLPDDMVARRHLCSEAECVCHVCSRPIFPSLQIVRKISGEQSSTSHSYSGPVYDGQELGENDPFHHDWQNWLALRL